MKQRKKDKKIKYVDLRQIDTDHDGLSDYDEINVYGSDPNNSDTDNDGIDDGDDVKQGFNPRTENIKNLFIPRRSNKYQPQILRPKRLVFYSFSAVLMKLIIIAFVFFVPITAFLTPDILSQESKKVIELTNKIRASLSISILKENSTLDQAAINKAQDMLLQQYFAHVGPDKKNLTDWLSLVGYSYDIAGENLALGFANASDVVNAWAKSKTHYANMIDPDFSEVGVGMVSGTYTGHDTTLAAQYFGAPRASAQNNTVTKATATPSPAPKPATPVAVKPASTTQPASVVTKTEGDKKVALAKIDNTPKKLIPTPVVAVAPKPQGVVVAAPTVATSTSAVVEKKIALAVPVLITPANNALVNQKEVQLEISAQQAQKVLVYNNSLEIAASNALNNGIINLAVQLNEGENKINIKSFRGLEFKVSPQYNISVDTVLPSVDIEKSKVIVSEPTVGDERVVKVTAYVSSDVKKAYATLADYKIDLQLTKDDLGKDVWSGQTIIFNYSDSKLFNTVVLPNITIEDQAGNISTYDISWDKIIPVNPSLLKQYFFIKDYPLSKNVNLLFDISGWFYKFILTVAIISLLLNIFIQIRRQYPRVILSTLGFILLLGILIVV
ncbi:MAG: CAP domain-containing protein [Patescibacteria group bacterium]